MRNADTSLRLPPRLSPRAARAQARRIGASLFAVMMTLILGSMILVAT